MMTAAEFWKSLRNQISPQEEKALISGKGLCISVFNRDVCLRLLENGCLGGGPVSSEKAERLAAELRDYLNEYMKDKPEGHKWIILACLYLTFLEHLPMHPQSAAKWTEKDGRYFCPSMEPDSITCSYCMCEKMERELL